MSIRSKINKYCLACRVSAEHELLSVDDYIINYKAVVTYKCKKCDVVRQFDYDLREPMSMEEIRKAHRKDIYGY